MTTERFPESHQLELLECMKRISVLRHESGREPRHKPMLGGPFGAGGFSVCSYHYVADLDYVMYYVRADASGFVIGSSEERSEATDHARKVLTLVDPFKLQAYMSAFSAWKQQYDADKLRKRQEEWEARRAQTIAALPSSVKSIPRRRKQIFDESGGKCHYCAIALELEGKWHIEHKHPKALGGGNEPGNLVAACVPCNTRKRDTTDLEFKARLAKEAA